MTRLLIILLIANVALRERTVAQKRDSGPDEPRFVSGTPTCQVLSRNETGASLRLCSDAPGIVDRNATSFESRLRYAKSYESLASFASSSDFLFAEERVAGFLFAESELL